MSTTVQPDQVATAPVENSRRIIPIFANLMPTEVVEVRRGRQARRLTLFALVVLAAIIGGVYALAVVQTSGVQSELDEVDARATKLTNETKQKQFADLKRTQDESQQVQKQLSALMAKDLPWGKLLAEVRALAPRGIGIDTIVTALAQQEAAGAEAPTTATVRPVGTITITGAGPSKPVIAGYADRLAGLAGVADLYLSSVTDQEGEAALTFTLRLSITEQALDGRFAKPTGGTAGKTGGR